jgi:hypothetical protein
MHDDALGEEVDVIWRRYNSVAYNLQEVTGT